MVIRRVLGDDEELMFEMIGSVIPISLGDLCMSCDGFGLLISHSNCILVGDSQLHIFTHLNYIEDMYRSRTIKLENDYECLFVGSQCLSC